jgi:small subunit ribosomal protein S6e
MKLVIGDPKTSKTYQMELKKELQVHLIGKKINQTIEGDLIGLPGYQLKITGGSDTTGIPMRSDVEGIQKKKILLSSGPGYKPKEKGIRKRKSVRGNTISADIIQVNLKVQAAGPKPLEELIPQTPKEKK